MHARDDLRNLRVEKANFQLAKYEGDRQPGQHPIEILQGGDDFPDGPVLLKPGDPGWDEALAIELAANGQVPIK